MKCDQYPIAKMFFPAPECLREDCVYVDKCESYDKMILEEQRIQNNLALDAADPSWSYNSSS